jgi:GrpB-like predicted nucleotidyltransferase (UPF0157 family)
MIKVVPYDCSWPAGLSAKPIIDICAAALDLVEFQAADPELRGIGYEPEDYGATGRLFYAKKDQTGERTHHLHVFPAGHWTTLKERIFPAHLRKYPEAARRYAELKVRLAGMSLDRETYTRGKTALIQELMDAAHAERGLPLKPVWEE